MLKRNSINAEKRGTRAWAENGDDFKKGKFSQAETDAVVGAVKLYAANNNVSVTSLCADGGDKATGKRAWTEISECLPERTVQAVYRHAIRQLHSGKRGPWKESELKELDRLVKKHGTRWKVIQGFLGRRAEQCRDKYRERLVKSCNAGWQQSEVDRLVELVEEKDKGHGGDMTLIQWADIAKVMGNRGRTACMKKWDSLQEKEMESGLQSEGEGAHDTNLLLAREVLKLRLNHESEVTWTRLPFPGAGARWRRMRKSVSPNLTMRKAAKAIISNLERTQTPKRSPKVSSTVTRRKRDAGGDDAKQTQPAKRRRRLSSAVSHEDTNTNSNGCADTDEDRDDDSIATPQERVPTSPSASGTAGDPARQVSPPSRSNVEGYEADLGSTSPSPRGEVDGTGKFKKKNKSKKKRTAESQKPQEDSDSEGPKAETSKRNKSKKKKTIKSQKPKKDISDSEEPTEETSPNEGPGKEDEKNEDTSIAGNGIDENVLARGSEKDDNVPTKGSGNDQNISTAEIGNAGDPSAAESGNDGNVSMAESANDDSTLTDQSENEDDVSRAEAGTDSTLTEQSENGDGMSRAEAGNDDSTLTADSENDDSTLTAETENGDNTLMAENRNDDGTLAAETGNDDSTVTAESENDDSTSTAENRNNDNTLTAETGNDDVSRAETGNDGNLLTAGSAKDGKVLTAQSVNGENVLTESENEGNVSTVEKRKRKKKKKKKKKTDKTRSMEELENDRDIGPGETGVAFAAGGVASSNGLRGANDETSTTRIPETPVSRQPKGQQNSTPAKQADYSSRTAGAGGAGAGVERGSSKKKKKRRTKLSQ